MRNSFKLLEEEQSQRYPGAPPEIEHKIQNEIGVMKAIGDILEMYLPKIVQVFVMLAGGDADGIGNNQRHQRKGTSSVDRGGADSSILPPHERPSGPGSPD